MCPGESEGSAYHLQGWGEHTMVISYFKMKMTRRTYSCSAVKPKLQVPELLNELAKVKGKFGLKNFDLPIVF